MKTRMLLAALALALPTAAIAQPISPIRNFSAIRSVETDSKLSPKQVTEIGTRGACWIMHWHDGLKLGLHGSGWILDVEKRLLITNEHVVAGRDVVEVFFPKWQDGKVQRDYQDYLLNGKAIRATVIDRDQNRDLALLQVDEIPEGMKALKLAEKPAEAGDLVRTVGGLPRGNEALWGTVSGEVRLVAKRRNGNGGYGMMVVTSMPANGGNSGGAILNERGEVVAVVEGGYTGRAQDGQITLNVTMHVDLSVLKSFLKEAVPLAEPADADAFVKRGERRMAAGRIDFAAADFSEAIKKDRENVRALIGRGRTFVAKGDYATAIGDFDEAIDIDDQSFDAFIARGRAKSALKRFDEAIADMTQAIRIDSNSLHGYNERGIVYHIAGKFSDAVADYTRAIRLAPTDVNLLANRAGSNEAMGKFDAAIADRKRVIEIQPNNDWRWNGLGRTCLRAKRFQDALDAFKKAAQLNPQEAIHVADIADVLLEDGQFEKAAKIFSDAVEMNRVRPTLNLTYILYRRGLARKGANDLDGAHSDFSEVIHRDPKHALAYLERGRVLREAGKEEAAAADFAKAKEINPKLDLDRNAGRKEKVAAKDDGLVGTWVCNSNLNGKPTQDTITLQARGNFYGVLHTQQPFGYWAEESYSGTYKIEGSTLTLTFNNGNEQSVKFKRTGDKVKVTFGDGSSVVYTLVK